METVDFNSILTQGPWAVLSVFLLSRIFKKTDQRNEDYINIIKENQKIMVEQQELGRSCKEIMKDNQKIVLNLTNKYEDIKHELGRTNENVLKIYNKVCFDKSCDKKE